MQVRAANLQELVYKQGQAGITKATVSIVFNNADKANSPVGYEHFEKITVTRQVSASEIASLGGFSLRGDICFRQERFFVRGGVRAVGDWGKKQIPHQWTHSTARVRGLPCL